MAQSNEWGVMVFHHSGETEDIFVADLVLDLFSEQIKTSAPCLSECLAKNDQILRTEEDLGSKANLQEGTSGTLRLSKLSGQECSRAGRQ